MNSILTNFDFFVQHDIHPFIIFDASGKIKHTNLSADLIINISTSKMLHNLALTYAPQTYGSSKTMIDVNISSYEFYCINVIYQNDSEIGIYLYHKHSDKKQNKKLFDSFSKTNINILLKARIELFKLNSNAIIKLLVDLDIPDFLTNQNDIALLLGKVFDKFQDLKNIDISLKIKVSEKIIIENKKYNIVVLSFSSFDYLDNSNNNQIKELAIQNHINIYLGDNSITLELPVIK